jgi:hypothetical protein
MAVREILIYPQHKSELRRKSDPLKGVNKQVRRLIRDLKNTLQYNSEGIGLVAPQINIHQRVVIVCVGDETSGEWRAGQPVVFIDRAEKMEGLYRLSANENGEFVRIQVSSDLEPWGKPKEVHDKSVLLKTI